MLRRIGVVATIGLLWATGANAARTEKVEICEMLVRQEYEAFQQTQQTQAYIDWRAEKSCTIVPVLQKRLREECGQHQDSRECLQLIRQLTMQRDLCAFSPASCAVHATDAGEKLARVRREWFLSTCPANKELAAGRTASLQKAPEAENVCKTLQAKIFEASDLVSKRWDHAYWQASIECTDARKAYEAYIQDCNGTRENLPHCRQLKAREQRSRWFCNHLPESCQPLTSPQFQDLMQLVRTNREMGCSPNLGTPAYGPV